MVAPADYIVRKSLLGKRFIKYACPNCSGDLESPIEEAGQNDRCPVCDGVFVVPGELEQRKLRMEAEAAEREAAARRQARIANAAKPIPPPLPVFASAPIDPPTPQFTFAIPSVPDQFACVPHRGGNCWYCGQLALPAFPQCPYCRQLQTMGRNNG
jgi:Zn-finger nucleic acid-binding protein